ncbi:MAG: site-specific DNA-methyltransferase [Bacteroidaceae bacterium]|nr:site-specific DNA-methyltransferase [Bacteroidaceae bacterium]
MNLHYFCIGKTAQRNAFPFKTSSVKEHSSRNKTILLSDAERKEYKRTLYTLRRLPERFVDCTIRADLFKVIDKLPSRFADLIIVDPPYNLSKQFGGRSFRAMSDDDYRAYIRSWLPRVIEKLKPDGSLYLCGDWRSSVVLYDELRPFLHVLNRITWQREKGRGAQRNWKNGMEDIWFAVADTQDYHFDVDAVKQRRRVLAPYRKDGKPKDWEETPDGNFRNTFPSNLWDDISIPYWSMRENTSHPTQKPEKLIAKLILASSAPGDIVFDPFVGSGTTSVVAKKLSRHYVGIEIDETYACLTEKRLALADADPSIQGYADGVFWERNTSTFTNEH